MVMTKKALDVLADQLIEQALAKTSLNFYLYPKNMNNPSLCRHRQLVCACDPLDGSSNIDNNLTIGTIFLCLPLTIKTETNLLYPGRDRVAAGFCLWASTALLLTYGNGVFAFCFDGTE